MNKIKKFLVFLFAVLVFLMPSAAYAGSVSSTTSPETLQGSVSVSINPYMRSWTTDEAYYVINVIGKKLVANNNIGKDVVFLVKDSEEVNASTDRFNNINVYTGLLKYVETEDELAFVIGHEMGHVEKGHVRKSIIRRGVTGTLAVAGTVMSALGISGASTAMTKTGLILTGSSLAGEVVNKKFSRGQETDADLKSIDYMVNSDYNPLAAVSMLNKIGGNYFDFFSDHPSGEKRILKAYNYIAQKYPEYIKKGYNSESYSRAMKIIENKNSKKTNKSKVSDENG